MFRYWPQDASGASHTGTQFLHYCRGPRVRTPVPINLIQPDAAAAALSPAGGSHLRPQLREKRAQSRTLPAEALAQGWPRTSAPPPLPLHPNPTHRHTCLKTNEFEGTAPIESRTFPSFPDPRELDQEAGTLGPSHKKMSYGIILSSLSDFSKKGSCSAFYLAHTPQKALCNDFMPQHPSQPRDCAHTELGHMNLLYFFITSVIFDFSATVRKTTRVPKYPQAGE